MKQLTLSFFAIAVICLTSCSKDPVVHNPSNPGSSQTVQPVQIVSDWMTMDFFSGGRENPDGLEAIHYFNPTIYDEQGHTRLAFVRTNDSRRALPAYLVVDGKALRMSFSLTFGSFIVMLNGDQYTSTIGNTPLSDCQFRYIVVANSVITGSTIDWSDYSQVANELGIVD